MFRLATHVVLAGGDIPVSMTGPFFAIQCETPIKALTNQINHHYDPNKQLAISSAGSGVYKKQK